MTISLSRSLLKLLIEPRLTGVSVDSGMEMLRWIRAKFPAAKIGVLTTANANDAEKAQQLGAGAVIVKPTNLRRVFQGVETLSAAEG